MSKKNENRQFVSASGTANDLVQKLAKAVYKLGGDDDDLRRIISDTSLCGRLADLIVGERPKNESQQYIVTIDPTKTLVQMIEAGKYDYANPDINEMNFPLEKSEGDGPYRTASTDVSLELVHFNKVMTTREIEAELDRRGLRSATLLEILAFGAKYPEIQREFPLVALGSSCVRPGGDRGVPCLGRGGSGRHVYLGWDVPKGRWGEDCRVVAVRK